MNRAADVVDEPGERQLRRADAAADRRRGLDQANGSTLARERDRRGEAVRAAPDDDGVDGVGATRGHWASVTSSKLAARIRIGGTKIPAYVRCHHAPVS